MCWEYCSPLGLRMTRETVNGTVPIFIVFRKKSQFSRTPISAVSGLVSRICSRFAHFCSRMLMHSWPKVSSDFICIYEKMLAAGALPQTRLGEHTMLPQTAKSDPRWLLVLAPYDSSCIELPKLQSPHSLKITSNTDKFQSVMD